MLTVAIFVVRCRFKEVCQQTEDEYQKICAKLLAEYNEQMEVVETYNAEVLSKVR